MAEFNSMSTRATVATDVQALSGVLVQIDELLAQMSQKDYICKPLNASGSIGGHTRHVIDHIQQWLGASHSVIKTERGLINYESRERGTDVECDVACGQRTLAEILDRLHVLPDAWTTAEVQVIQMLHPDLPPVAMPSSLSRELAFVISHTIHHQAIIAQIAATLDLSLPDGFGYAPATLAYLRRTGR